MLIIVLLNLLVNVDAIVNYVRHETSISLQAAIETPRNMDTLPIVDFKDFLKHTDAVVDKSLLIKEVIQHPSKVLLITCPRRWGKSVNLNMLRTFFEIEQVDVAQNETDNYKLFKYGQIGVNNGTLQSLKPPFLISKHDDILDQYQGKFPVIYLNFLDRTTNDYMESMVGLVNGIQEAFRHHDYIRLWLHRRTNDLNDTDMQREYAKGQYLKFTRIRNHVNSKYAENLQDLETSILYLSELLRQYHGKRVIVLIDEFETPINMQLLNVVYPEDVDKLTDFFSRFFHFTFNLNDHLEKAVLTGITQPCYDKWLSQVDGLTIYDVRSNDLTQYYGFMRQEVESLFYHFKITPELAAEAHQRYNGYTMNTRDIEIYNPWSIVKFLNNKTVDHYWEKTGHADMMTYLFDIKSLRWLFSSLLQGVKALVHFQGAHSTRSEFLELRQLIHTAYENCEMAAECKSQGKPATFKNFQVNSTTVDVIMSYLFSTGYITNGGKTGKTVRLPNQEVRVEMMQRMINYYKIVHGVNMDYVCKMVRALVDFVTSESTVDAELSKHFETLFEDMKVIGKDNIVKEDVVHTMLDILSLVLYHEFQFQAEARVDENKILMLFSKEFLGVIIAVQFNIRSIDQVVEIAGSYQNFYRKQEHIGIIKFIGIGVTPQREVRIKAGFWEKG